MQKDTRRTHGSLFSDANEVLCPNCGSIRTEFHNKFKIMIENS